MEVIKSIDLEAFLFLNGFHNPFFDIIMYWVSERFIWIPMYLFMSLFIIRHYKWESILIFVGVALTITLCDQIASGLIKNWAERLRPSHEPGLVDLVHLTKAGTGGMYGFVSSHAANTFGMTTFLWVVLDSSFNGMKYWLVAWASFVSYSRIYNGLHYPGDVIAATILGAVLGYLVGTGCLIIKRRLLISGILKLNENNKSG